MSNPYAPPRAQLEREVFDVDEQGSLEAGINGEYGFSIGGIVAEAWGKVKGVKGTFFLAFLIYFVVSLAVGAILGRIFPVPALLFQQHQWGAGFFWMAVITLIDIPLMYPLLAGIVMLGIMRSIDAKPSVGLIFHAYTKTLPITILAILITVLTLLGSVLLILPGIYLSVAYMMSIALMVDRDMGAWEAMETSRKAITKHWFKFFFLYLFLAIIFLVAALPLMIGLIWALPLLAIVHGLVYKKMFGVASAGESGG